MAVSKVDYCGSTLIDLTGDTVNEATLAKGITAHDKSGEAIVGTMEAADFPTPTAGETPVASNFSIARVNKTSYTASGVYITIKKAGTYRFKWAGFRNNTTGTWGSQLYKNGVAQGSAQTSFTNSYYQTPALELQCNAGDKIEIYARARSTSYYMNVGNLEACINWDNTY